MHSAKFLQTLTKRGVDFFFLHHCLHSLYSDCVTFGSAWAGVSFILLNERRSSWVGSLCWQQVPRGVAPAVTPRDTPLWWQLQSTACYSTLTFWKPHQHHTLVFFIVPTHFLLRLIQMPWWRLCVSNTFNSEETDPGRWWLLSPQEVSGKWGAEAQGTQVQDCFLFTPQGVLKMAEASGSLLFALAFLLLPWWAWIQW